MFRLPIGTAPQLLLILLAISGAWILLHPIAEPVSQDGEILLRMWVFALDWTREGVGAPAASIHRLEMEGRSL